MRDAEIDCNHHVIYIWWHLGCFTFLCCWNVQVFMQAFIPRKLDDVIDFERDVECVREGIDTDLVCARNLVLSLYLCFIIANCCYN